MYGDQAYLWLALTAAFAWFTIGYRGGVQLGTAALYYAVSVGTWVAMGNRGKLGLPSVAGSASPIELVALGVACVFGFGLCPYLDLTFHRARYFAGGRAGLGSHGQLQGLGAHWETWNLASGGLTPHETLQVVTMQSAEAIGLQQDVGSLEPGKLADLLVLDRNPLDNIRNTNTIRYVVKNGVVHDGNTLDEIWPRQRTFPKFRWMDEEAAYDSLKARR